MSNKSVSDFVAATMDAVLKSEAHKSLFGTQYKFASDENDAKKCKGCGCPMDKCDCGDCDDNMADDNADADPAAPKVDPKTKAVVSGEQGQHISFPPDKIKGNVSKADDSDADDDEKEEAAHLFDSFKEESEGMSESPFANLDVDALPTSSAAFDVAIDSLLTASAALDSVGMEKSATFSLKLASLVVEAKKQDKEKEKAKKEKEKAAKAKEKEKAAKAKEKEKAAKAKEKAKADAQSAKDKAAKLKAKEKADKEKEKNKAKPEKDEKKK